MVGSEAQANWRAVMHALVGTASGWSYGAVSSGIALWNRLTGSDWRFAVCAFANNEQLRTDTEMESPTV